MGCNHRYRKELVRGSWPRPAGQAVRADTRIVLGCPACGALRIDSSNEFCYARGAWSGRHQDNIRRMR
jgi:hypothetical protein